MNGATISLDDVFVRQGEEMGTDRGMFIIALSDDRAYGLSPLAYVVWYMCDGRIPLRTVVENISENTDVEPSIVERKVIEVVRELLRVGLLVRK